MKQIIRIPLGELQIHELVLNIKYYKPNQFMTFSMEHYGQKTPVVVVSRKGKYFIIDGGHRYHSATEVGNIETLECFVIDIPDSEILDTRITYNLKTKVHTHEICTNIEHMLGLMGNDQGKRNDLLGNENFNVEDEFGTAGKDKFEIACMNSGLKFSGRTLRKLMAVHEFEKGERDLKLIEGIDSGKLSIDKAHKLMNSYLKKLESDSAPIVPLPSLYEKELNHVSYKLFNKSSMVMNEIEDESIAKLTPIEYLQQHLELN